MDSEHEHEVAVLQAVRTMVICKQPVPVPKAGELLVRVTHAGICGSDLHYFRHGGLGSFKTPLPMPMGHEPAGIVISSNGSCEFKEGDRVAIEPGCPCLTSKWSLLGKHNLCERGTFMGADNTPGCFSTYVCVKEIQLFKIPDNVDLDVASVCEPLSIALHTYKLCGNRTHDLINGSAIIFGAGPIGLGHLIILKAQGVRNVFVVDMLEYRRNLARELGASAVFATGAAFTTGRSLLKKCELVIDCAGTVESFDDCLRAAAVNGTLALVGIPEVDFLNFNPHQARIKELVIINVRRSNQCLETCLRMLSESPEIAKQCKRLISHEMPLKDIQRAFEMASEYEGCMKILIRPDMTE
jgi:L-iditol 2-dehydrogenase